MTSRLGFPALLLAIGAGTLSAQPPSPIDTTKLLADNGASYYTKKKPLRLPCIKSLRPSHGSSARIIGSEASQS